MTQMKPEVQKSFRDEVLPEIHRRWDKRCRQHVVWKIILLTPFILAIGLILDIWLILRQVEPVRASLSGGCLGLSVFSFLGISKIDISETKILLFDVAVWKGDMDMFNDALKQITNINMFEGVIDNVRKIFSAESLGSL